MKVFVVLACLVGVAFSLSCFPCAEDVQVRKIYSYFHLLYQEAIDHQLSKTIAWYVALEFSSSAFNLVQIISSHALTDFSVKNFQQIVKVE